MEFELSSLHVNSNNITNVGASAFKEALLHNNALSELNLWGEDQLVSQ